MKNFYLVEKLKKVIPAAIGLLALVIFLASCSASGKFKRAYDSRSIPDDIKKDGYVLLVLKQDVGGFRASRIGVLKNSCAGTMELPLR